MPDVNVKDLTFGVEFETVMPVDVITSVGSYHNGIQIPQLPPGWTAQRDCSISSPSGHTGIEIVSPILKGEDGVKQIKFVCDWMNSVGAKVNRSTGFHVHVGWAGDDAALNRLATYVSNFEKALFASTGTHSRETGHFCQPIQNNTQFVDRFRDKRTAALPINRYHILNLTNLRSGRNTVEFRVFAGTTNASKALGYLRLCLGIVEKALRTSRAPKWVGKTPVETSPLHRKGQGQTELTRLFYSLGWIKGDSKHLFGDIQIDGAPSIDDSKKELMRLARKYDGGDDEIESRRPDIVATPTMTPDQSTGSHRWESWTPTEWQEWFRSLRPGSRIFIYTVDGTRCDATVLRRYARSVSVRVSHLSSPLLINFGEMMPRS